jgi:hypothetical protein
MAPAATAVALDAAAAAADDAETLYGGCRHDQLAKAPPPRLMVCNRGEVARRIIKTANLHGLETVAVYTQVRRRGPGGGGGGGRCRPWTPGALPECPL